MCILRRRIAAKRHPVSQKIVVACLIFYNLNKLTGTDIHSFFWHTLPEDHSV